MAAVLRTTTVTPPTTVLVPVSSTTVRDGTLEVMLRSVSDDLLVLPTYSSVAALVEGCGEDQPWVELPAAVVDRQLTEWGAVAALLDVALAAADRWAGPPVGSVLP